MKRIAVTVVLFVSVMLFVSSANAFFPRGRINENYSYDNLTLERIEKGRNKGKCYLRGTITNETDKRREDVKITFYAMTIVDKTLWRAIVKIDLIDRYGTFDFRVKIRGCKEEEPYKWEFKVKDRNK
ncbi:hypothetical protein [Desulfonema magnum]|uniref:Uncharacterized protein n=1 Tax=Desulfonema magnum TaxID=45655 RepID=A0A975BXM2_9BACT|nr:hypothetical protein [Desulfonema magnum]QTA93183.1 Uncharacterized protein dnm_092810 [Desulfonema magnum]